MDFLKDIVKEIGGEYTQLASDIDDHETYVDTGSYIFNGLVSGSRWCIWNKITPLLRVYTEKLFSVSPLSRTS